MDRRPQGSGLPGRHEAGGRAALEAARAEVDRLYRRWAELEEKQR